jgi:hypothetical protein
MRESIDVMKIALRVLTAVSQKHAPDSQDIADLESFAGPKPPDVDLDEFTCSVIQVALKKRAVRRTSALRN